MKKGSPLSIEKNAWRKILLERRKNLVIERRLHAKEVLTKDLLSLFSAYPYILSFQSMHSEIDLSSLNHALRLQNKLLLPKVEGDNLLIVDTVGAMIEPKEIPCILVPGLGFDLQFHRIGYGKGYYDRFLKEVPHALKIGIGFREQWVKSLPIEQHDQKLDQVLLF